MTEINYSEEIAKNESINWNVRDEYKGLSFEQLRSICHKEQLPFAACILNITGELNVGMIIRSASLLGAQKIFLIGRRKYDKRSTVGAQHYLDVERIDGLDTPTSIDSDLVINKIQQEGYDPVAVEGPNQYQTPVNVRDIDWWNEFPDSPPCLIFGSESDGIPGRVLQKCRMTVCIQQFGVLRSFNVSSAASIVMYEVASQLRPGGF